MDMTVDRAAGADIPADIAATLVNPAAYADHRIHDCYRWLRANNPLGAGLFCQRSEEGADKVRGELNCHRPRRVGKAKRAHHF
jgi:hypothetical protein